MQTCSGKLEWEEKGRDWVTKGFANHTEEFEPYVESSREHIHSDMNERSLVTAADAQRGI